MEALRDTVDTLDLLNYADLVLVGVTQRVTRRPTDGTRDCVNILS